MGTEMNPSIGQGVHYTSYGTPAGEFSKTCRAAIITSVWYTDEQLTEPAGDVGLCVLNPTGMFFNERVPFSAGGETPGQPDCPNSEAHGNPFRYCACGWIEAGHKGGTWHWAEAVA